MNPSHATNYSAAPPQKLDVIIIGAGLGGMYQLVRVRELGMSVCVIEAGSDVGGTWFWNRYPGARFDSESYSYGYSFSKELLQEWEWTEHFAPQPETLRYAGFVADKFKLRQDILFNRKLVSAEWNETSRDWHLTLDTGEKMVSQFLITAIGPLSVPTLPNIAGVKDYTGIACHTADWPREPVSFADKRVAVLGTGATGIQTIQEVAKTAGHLTVFQRTANWSAPLHNGLITDEQQSAIKASYSDIFKRCQENVSGFLHNPDPRRGVDVSEQERKELWEKLYKERGFSVSVGNFCDLLTNTLTNAWMSEFIADKIRERVKDPVTAERLIPKNHGFGTRRLPLESGYFEAYNQPNVELVDLLETPIERITATGIKTTAREFEFDMIIYATGFDALTGAYDQIDLRGIGGQSLKDQWAAGAKTFHGFQNAGFPNLLMILGPMGALGNIPRILEYNVDWVSRLLAYMQTKKLSRVEASAESVEAWMDVVKAASIGLLANDVDSWMTGVNKNVEGKSVRVLARYSGSGPEFRARCDAVAAGGYAELNLK
jgi:cation diffusion facilitator CzcD-associated flavoprotein CzcO